MHHASPLGTALIPPPVPSLLAYERAFLPEVPTPTIDTAELIVAPAVTYAQLRAARAFLAANGLVEVPFPAELHPGVQYAAHFMLDDMHRIELYFDMDQIGWNGEVRPPAAPMPGNAWPETLPATAATFAGHIRQGPLG